MGRKRMRTMAMQRQRRSSVYEREAKAMDLDATQPCALKAATRARAVAAVGPPFAYITPALHRRCQSPSSCQQTGTSSEEREIRSTGPARSALAACSPAHRTRARAHNSCTRLRDDISRWEIILKKIAEIKTANGIQSTSVGRLKTTIREHNHQLQQKRKRKGERDDTESDEEKRRARRERKRCRGAVEDVQGVRR